MKSKLAVYASMFVLSTSTLASCGSNDRQIAEEDKNNYRVKHEQNSNAVEGDKKVFEPYQHLFYVRNSTSNVEYSEKVTGGSVNIPEGYTVLDIENFTELSGYGSQTGGYDIWYTNTKTVEVSAVYNESIDGYDYSHFGTVIEDEKTREEDIKEKVK